MKTTALFRMMVLAVIIIAGAMSATVKAQNSNFVTNEEVVNNQVVSKVIYKLDGYLYNHMKYDFTYDAENRVASKEALKWDGSKEAWMPSYKINYSYTGNEMTLAYSRWSKDNKSYENVSEESTYRMDDNNVAIAFISNNKTEQLLANN